MAEDVGTYTEGKGFSFNNLLNKTGALFETWAAQSIAKQFEKENQTNPVIASAAPTTGTDWKMIGLVVVGAVAALWLGKKLL